MKYEPLSRKDILIKIRKQTKSKPKYPFGENIEVYSISGKMFAILSGPSDPIRLSLRCDPSLSQTLQEKYETVMPGDRLNKNQWITVVLTGQLSLSEVDALIVLSAQLVKSE